MLTTKQIADEWRVSRSTVTRWIRNGQLKAELKDNKYSIKEEDFDAFVRKCNPCRGTRPLKKRS